MRHPHATYVQSHVPTLRSAGAVRVRGLVKGMEVGQEMGGRGVGGRGGDSEGTRRGTRRGLAGDFRGTRAPFGGLAQKTEHFPRVSGGLARDHAGLL